MSNLKLIKDSVNKNCWIYELKNHRLFNLKNKYPMKFNSENIDLDTVEIIDIGSKYELRMIYYSYYVNDNTLQPGSITGLEPIQPRYNPPDPEEYIIIYEKEPSFIDPDIQDLTVFEKLYIMNRHLKPKE